MSKIIKTTSMYVFISVAAFFSVFPFIWMVMGATSTSVAVSTGVLGFGGELINNFVKLNELVDLPRILANTAYIAVTATVLTLIIASLAGYGFEMYKNRLREGVYQFLLLTMMIPFAAIMIPLFRLFANAGLLNSYWAVILPSLASVFVIFYFRQSTKTFQKELIQAARVDGLNEFQAFFLIFVPTMKSTYAAASIIVFMSAWNSFLWPLIVLQDVEKRTMTLMLSSIASSYTPDFGVIMLGIVITTLPTLLIFFTMQKHFVEGMMGSIK